MKHEQIRKLDNSIADLIQMEEELESEICDADTYQTMLEQQTAVLTEFMKKANQPPAVVHPTHHPIIPNDTTPALTSARTTPTATSPSTETTPDFLPETKVSEIAPFKQQHE